MVTYVSVDKFAPSWIMALFCGRTFVKMEHCGSPNGTTALSSTLFNNDEMQITNLSDKLWSNAVVLHISVTFIAQFTNGLLSHDLEVIFYL